MSCASLPLLPMQQEQYKAIAGLTRWLSGKALATKPVSQSSIPDLIRRKKGHVYRGYVCTQVMQTHNNNKGMDKYILNKNLYCLYDFCGHWQEGPVLQ